MDESPNVIMESEIDDGDDDTNELLTSIKPGGMSVDNSSSGAAAANDDNGPWIQQHFQMRACVGYKKKPDGRCCCGLLKADHINPGKLTKLARNVEWNPEMHTNNVPTSVFSSSSKYIRFALPASETSAAEHEKENKGDEKLPLVVPISELLTNKWEGNKPELIVNLVGSVSDDSISDKMILSVQNGLKKLRTQEGYKRIWVITDGYKRSSTFKVIERLLEGFTTIGLPQWSKVADKERLVHKRTSEKQCNKSRIRRLATLTTLTDDVKDDVGTLEVALAQHDIMLILDEYTNGPVANNNARNRLFNLPMFSDTPIVNVMLGAAVEFFPFIGCCDNKAHPIVVIGGSGGLCDVITAALMIQENGASVDAIRNDGKLKSLITTTIDTQIKKEAVLTGGSIENCKANVGYLDVDAIQKYIADFLVNPCCSVFREEKSRSDTEFVQCLFKALAGQMENENTSQSMNLNILKISLKIENTNIIDRLNKEMFPDGFFSQLLKTCVLQNQSDIVNNILNSGAADIEDFFQKSSDSVSSVDKIIPSGDCKRMFNFDTSRVYEEVERLIGGGFRMARPEMYYNETNDKVTVKNENVDSLSGANGQYLQFFFWSILNGYTDLAHVFWSLDGNKMAKALVAVRLYDCIGEGTSNETKKLLLQDESQRYEDLAYNLLEDISNLEDPNFEKALTTQLSICKNGGSEHSAIDLIQSSQSSKIIVHSTIQKVMDTMWAGKLKKCDHLQAKIIACSFIPLLSFLLLKTNLSSSNKAKNKKRRDNPLAILYYLYDCPASKFYVNVVIFTAFLLTFQYVVLAELPRNVTWIEIALATMVVSISTGEVLQFIDVGGTFSSRISGYLSDIWNYFDMTGVILFWTAFGLRFVEDDLWLNIARYCYIMDLFVWFMRLLNLFSISKRLGPLVTVIMKMVPILLQFFTIWILFMASFGVVITAITNPKWYGTVTYEDMLNVLDHSYWQTYGELFLTDLRKIAESECVNGTSSLFPDKPCPFLPTSGMLFLAAYLVAGNILLLNLLIAVFSSLYESTNENALVDWTVKNMDIIIEYRKRSILPSPFAALPNVVYILFQVVGPLNKWNPRSKVFTLYQHTVGDFEDKVLAAREVARRAQTGDRGESMEELNSKLNEMNDVLTHKMEGIEKKIETLMLIIQNR